MKNTPQDAAMSPDPDRILSLADGPEVETREKGSRFLGIAFSIDTDAEAATKLETVRQQYPDASHHCWASRSGLTGVFVDRSDDDGEPAGTAGLPILGAIERYEVTQVLVVVTRYFGGTKLGKGGLVRAYGEAAREAIEAAPERVLWRETRVSVALQYDDVGAAEAVLARHAASLRDIARDFSGAPKVTFWVRRSLCESLLDALRDATRGRAAMVVD